MTRCQRITAAAGAAALGAALFAATPAAEADYTFYRTSPHTGACWDKVNAYGGVYQITNNLLNGTSRSHTAQVKVWRPGTGTISDQSYTARAGEWKVGAEANVGIFAGDHFVYKLNGTTVADIPAAGIPFYMNHCEVEESPSSKVRTALNHGLAQLDSVYVGCAAGAYRFGKVPTSTLYHDGRGCGQSRIYKQPAGRKGFDCSGLVAMMYRAAGVNFPWESSAAMAAGIPQISKSSLRPGDLLVKGGSHVAIYLGDGNGDGHASVLEATPRFSQSDGTYNGVVIGLASRYVNDPAYDAHRVPGT